MALGLVLKLEDILVGAFGTLHEYERLALLDGHLEKFRLDVGLSYDREGLGDVLDILAVLTVFLDSGAVNPCKVLRIARREHLVVNPKDSVLVTEPKIDVAHVDMLDVSFLLHLTDKELRPRVEEHHVAGVPVDQ